MAKKRGSSNLGGGEKATGVVKSWRENQPSAAMAWRKERKHRPKVGVAAKRRVKIGRRSINQWRQP